MVRQGVREIQVLLEPLMPLGELQGYGIFNTWHLDTWEKWIYLLPENSFSIVKQKFEMQKITRR